MISVAYFIFLGCAAILYWVIIPQKWRCPFLAITGFAFAAAVSRVYTVLFLIVTCIVWAAGVSFSCIGSPLKKKLTAAGLLLFLAGGFCAYKLFHAGRAGGSRIPFPGVIVFGFSYFIFRIIHYLVECYRGGIPARSLIEVVCYVFFFPAFLAGPIERFPAFIAQKNPGSTPAVEINYGLYRITRGVLKKVFLADTLLPVIVPFLQNPAGVNRGFLLVSLYALAVQIYLDFSGYTDIAVGSARLFGYRIMENFDRPFFKTTIAQFWRSWHMSLYTWIRDYFFFPVFGRKASRYSLYAGLFCTMLVFNLWHGFTARFIVLGVYHGVLLAGWQAFRELKQRIPFLRQMTGSPPLDAVSAFLTFNAVSFGFMLFVCDIPQAGRLIKRLAGLC